MERGVEPGGAGDGLLFLILGFRAIARNKLPLSVVIAGGCSVAVSLGFNHSCLRSHDFIWTVIWFLLLAFVTFWSRRNAAADEHTCVD